MPQNTDPVVVAAAIKAAGDIIAKRQPEDPMSGTTYMQAADFGKLVGTAAKAIIAELRAS